MVDQETLSGDWNRAKGKLREKWGDLADDELDRARGNVQQLVGLVQRKTGKSREEIEEYLESAFGDQSWFAELKHNVGEYGESAAHAVTDSASYAADQMRAGYIQSERMIRSRPGESLAVCFAAGVATGVMAALLLRSR